MKELKIALIGCGFMGKTHSIAYSNIPMYFFPSSVTPVKEIVTNVTEPLAKKAAEQYGFNKWTTRWEDVIADKSIDIIGHICLNTSSVLLCYEKDPKDCHRNILAREISFRTGLLIQHF